MSDRFEIFNKTAKNILAAPDIHYDRLTEIFREIENYTFLGITELVRYSTFVEDNLCYILYRIAGGAVKNEKYSTYSENNKGFVSLGDDVQIGTGNLHILSIGYNLFRLSKTPRPQAETDVIRVLHKLNLRNSRYEAVLRTFDAITDKYCDLETDLVQQKSLLDNIEDSNIVIDMLQKISNLTDEKRLIEQKVGSVYPEYLYGLVRRISSIVKHISKLQNIIVTSYMKLVVVEVRKYAYSDMQAGDMLQAGSFGLWRAVSDYDYRQRMAFPTFAKRWIIQRIQAFRKSSGGPLIHIPPSTWKLYQKIQSTVSRLTTDLNIFDPDDNMIAEELGWSVSKVQNILQEIQAAQVVSYDQDQNEDAEWKEVSVYNTEDNDIVYTQTPEVSEKDDKSRDLVLRLLNHLTTAERKVICLRNGLLDGLDNSGIDEEEVLNEMLRQLSCKVKIGKVMSNRLDGIYPSR